MRGSRTPGPGDRHRGPPPFLTGLLLLSGLLLAATSCSTAHPRLQPPDRLPTSEEPGPLKVHLHGGDVVVLTQWGENAATRRITGYGTRYDAHRAPRGRTGRVDLPVDSVALLEVTRPSTDVGKGLGITLMASYTVLTGAVSLICMANPKSCFGSCPTFYVDDDHDGGSVNGPRERLVAEGFSSSVARALEATDVDDLRIRAAPGPFSLRMRNEALETHAVRSLRLHAVPEREGERVLSTPTGEFRTARQMFAPVRCSGPEGDCLPAIRALDGMERTSLTDPGDLARREYLELEFRVPAPEGGGAARFGVALAARHSFVSTFLFYQMLGYLGRDAAPLLASLERGDRATLERIRDLKAIPGRLEVTWMDAHGIWQSAGAYVEAGPLATDLQLLELPEIPLDRPLRIRLDLAQGFWRLEHVALVELGEDPVPVTLSPVRVHRVGPGVAGEPGQALETPASDALATLLHPDHHLVTEPGDHFRIDFDLPVPSEAGPTGPGSWSTSGGPGSGDPPMYRLFLESTGYYYEWMRKEWMADESPERAATLFFDPERAFRELAPAFKRLEPEMEEAFWASRFRR